MHHHQNSSECPSLLGKQLYENSQTLPCPFENLDLLQSLYIKFHSYCRARRSSRQVGNKFQLGARYPPINWGSLSGIFNRTFSFREDADAIVQHGYFEKLNEKEMPSLPSNPAWTTKFENYTKDNFNSTLNKDKAPIIW